MLVSVPEELLKLV